MVRGMDGPKQRSVPGACETRQVRIRLQESIGSRLLEHGE